VKQLYALLFCLLLSFQLSAQELAKKSTLKNNISEKFLVQKKDKSVKHGQYLRIYSVPYLGDNLMELGQYEHNQKTGTWITFYHTQQSNPIQSVGDYKNGKKDGEWSYFHELFDQSLSTRPVYGSIKKTRITPPEKGALEYTVEMNGEDHILESKGLYEDDKKVGAWEYYDQNGNLTQRYNHTTRELLEDRTKKPENAYMTYIGGMNRFRLLFYAAQRTLPPVSEHITQDSEAVFELEDNGSYRFISVSGDTFLKEHMAKALSTLPNDWIYAEEGTADKAKLQVSLQVKKPQDKSGLQFYIRFNAEE
jgi:antitoxin component YwqK of YwqJK toxin-antitoxin module